MSNKPKWEDAPKWANWLAMDYGGTWWWYEKKPRRYNKLWDAVVGRSAPANSNEDAWTETLEPRPKPTKP